MAEKLLEYVQDNMLVISILIDNYLIPRSTCDLEVVAKRIRLIHHIKTFCDNYYDMTVTKRERNIHFLLKIFKTIGRSPNNLCRKKSRGEIREIIIILNQLLKDNKNYIIETEPICKSIQTQTEIICSDTSSLKSDD